MNKWLKFDTGLYSQNCEYIINRQKHQIDNKVGRPDLFILTRLRYAN